MANTPHAPTEKSRAEVSALCSFGIPQSEIAIFLGIDAKTLRKHYREELDVASTKANAQVGRFLFQNASGQTLKSGASHGDCVRAAMFWAKTRMGWREKDDATQVQVSNFAVLDADTYKQARKEILEKDDC